MTLKLDPHNPLATKVQTRDGRKARIICTDANCARPIVALITTVVGVEEVRTHILSGRYFNDVESPSDLINVPETKSSWVAVVDGEPRSVWEYRSDIERFVKCSVIELRMCDGKLVDAIQHEVEK